MERTEPLAVESKQLRFKFWLSLVFNFKTMPRKFDLSEFQLLNPYSNKNAMHLWWTVHLLIDQIPIKPLLWARCSS